MHQDIRIFLRANKFVTVPTSTPGSIFPSSCSCSTAGGFEGGSSTGLVGCTPCEDGYYSAPGMQACQQCPAGKYAARLVGQRDFYRCPNATSPAIRFSPAYVWKSPVPSNMLGQLGCMQLAVGADACTSCPASRPYTLGAGSTSLEDCRRCPSGMYMDNVLSRCVQCRAACSKELGEYETKASPWTQILLYNFVKSLPLILCNAFGSPVPATKTGSAATATRPPATPS